MRAATAQQESLPHRERVYLDDIRVGKDVIEILTSGMYVSPITIYREYIQNAADSIDAARAAGLLTGRKDGSVCVEIDNNARSVMIRDNGAGLPTRDAAEILVAIGASAKRGSIARGFRGVGRLSGLAYCRELEFRTKASGDTNVVSVIWNCRGLRDRLSNAEFGGDLKRVISEVVSVWSAPANHPDDHFFEVHLRDIARLRNDMLLNEAVIAHYLGQVAPVPFASDFSFGAQIEKRLAMHSAQIPLHISVVGQQIFRPIRDEMMFPASTHKLRITNIEFLEFPNVDGTTGALGWIGHHEYVRSITQTLGVRGLRARVGNLQVGDANLFDEIFKETRFNGWSIGEVHVIDPRIVPNARRDNFEINHHYYNLLVQLGPVALNISQRCRSASVSRNAEQTVLNAVAEVGKRLKEKRGIDRAELSRLKSMVVRALAKVKRIEAGNRRNELERRLGQLQGKLKKLTPKRGASIVAIDELSPLVSKFVTNRAQAEKLMQAVRRLCE
jgi:molecular chaperone HtpG